MSSQTALIFDLDGTLTRPFLDFDAIRAEIGLPPGPILESLADLAATDRARAEAILDQHERRAAEESTLQPDAHEILAACRGAGYPVAIMTRNSRVSVEHFLRKHGMAVDAVRTREDGAIKPSPEPVLSLCRQLGAASGASWVVGDYLFDLLSGKAAGTRTVLMIGDGEVPEYTDQADHVIRRLAELLPLWGIFR